MQLIDYQTSQQNCTLCPFFIPLTATESNIKNNGDSIGFHYICCTNSLRTMKTSFGMYGFLFPNYILTTLFADLSAKISLKEVRCFRFPVPILFPREAVSVSPLLKKFYENILHFLHHKGKCIVIIGDFGCRIGCRMRCRIALQGVGTHRSYREIDKKTAEKDMISCQKHKETARH